MDPAINWIIYSRNQTIKTTWLELNLSHRFISEDMVLFVLLMWQPQQINYHSQISDYQQSMVKNCLALVVFLWMEI